MMYYLNVTLPKLITKVINLGTKTPHIHTLFVISLTSKVISTQRQDSDFIAQNIPKYAVHIFKHIYISYHYVKILKIIHI